MIKREIKYCVYDLDSDHEVFTPDHDHDLKKVLETADKDPKVEVKQNTTDQNEVLHDHFLAVVKRAAVAKWQKTNNVKVETARRIGSTWNDATGKWDYGEDASMIYALIPSGKTIYDATQYVQICPASAN